MRGNKCFDLLRISKKNLAQVGRESSPRITVRKCVFCCYVFRDRSSKRKKLGFEGDAFKAAAAKQNGYNEENVLQLMPCLK